MVPRPILVLMKTTKHEIRTYRPASPMSQPEVNERLSPLSFFRALGFIGAENEHADLVRALRHGVSAGVLDNLATELGASQSQMCHLIGISPSTLRRRRHDGRLIPTESDRAYRLAAVLCTAFELFEGNKQAARRWLQQPAKALGGNTPLDYLDTEAGADAVRDLMGRVEHSIFA